MYGVYSRNIILESQVQISSKIPVEALIIINNGIIQHILQVSTEIYSISYYRHRLNMPIYNYGNFFVLPGLIDLNVCVNLALHSDGISEVIYENVTRLAVQGGVTLLIDHPSFLSDESQRGIFQERVQQVSKSKLSCDVGLLILCDPKRCISEEEERNVVGYKISLSQQFENQTIFNGVNLIEILNHSEQTQKPIFVVPELANSRYLLLTSPFRFTPIQKRKDQILNKQENIAGQFNDDNATSASGGEIEKGALERLGPKLQSLKDKASAIEENKSVEIQNELSTYQESGKTTYNPDFASPLPNPRNINKRLSLTIPPIHTPTSRINSLRPTLSLKTTQLASSSAVSSSNYAANYPTRWESNLVQTLTSSIPNESNAKLHICNLSSPMAIMLCKEFKILNPGAQVTTESTLPHLLISSNMINDSDTKYKVKPPLRGKEVQELLTEMVQVGGVDCISSFHREVPTEFKFRESFDFQRALSGFPTLGYNLCAAFTQIRGDPRNTLPKIAKIMASKPAKILGRSEIGSIQTGKQANLVIFDPDNVTYWDGSDYIYEELSPFDGQIFKGKVVEVILRGQQVYSDGKLNALKGKFIRSKQFNNGFQIY